MLGRPVYGAFSSDLAMRTNIHLEHVSVGDTEQISPACVLAFGAGFEAAKARGINNALEGVECYSRETLIGLLYPCASKGIHLISDEIYGFSVYEREDRQPETFTPVRAIDFNGIINPNQVHVLHGMSKDFGASSMRLGCIISENEDFTKATRAICRFSSPSQFSMDLTAKFLEDQDFVTNFLHKLHHCLLQSRLLAEDLLARKGISYSPYGDAGLFLWLDLSSHLPLHEINGDGWAAQRLLSRRFSEGSVIISTGEEYRAPNPGRFRLVFCVDPDTLKEGVERISRVQAN
ncbi:pyridoxal phosphate-dependent transferase [Aspergillus alliaceus]|uniref:Pyridoxal phosphate-dependent transferase n=1 Tax=Petromyces alliaceus TaxID=209559 RepID=A0A5N7BR54_PETAA|nr:pyridoxal phosphate-dependent transferase [Aspergillus alliaceus]